MIVLMGSASVGELEEVLKLAYTFGFSTAKAGPCFILLFEELSSFTCIDFFLDG